MASEIGEGAWFFEGARAGRRVCISFGVHGNERPPIDAGLRLVEELRSGQRRLVAGALLVLWSNPRASEQNERWSRGGVDLNRCFHPSVTGRAPELWEEGRAREIAGLLQETGAEVLVDFHCTVEPGERFVMHHPPTSDAGHRELDELLAARVVLADPDLRFGGVSLDEWMSTRGRVGVCYETGWIGDPENTAESVHGEMVNVLAGTGLTAGEVRRHHDKRRIELFSVVTCDGEGFKWDPGIGENLQALAAGTRLGSYADGREVEIGEDATLVFPKKKPELVQRSKPLVYLARKCATA